MITFFVLCLLMKYIYFINTLTTTFIFCRGTLEIDGKISFPLCSRTENRADS